MNNLIKLVLISSITFLPGCRHLVVKQALNQMKTNLENVMGLTTEETIIKLGAPHKIENIGNLQIYHYYQDYGICNNIFATETYGAGNTWQSYDKSEITFKDDRAISWRCNAQR